MRFPSFALLGAAALLVGCGSTGTPTTATTTDSGVTTTDASISDAGGTPAVDSSTNPPVDSGPKCDTVGTTADQCRTCCETGFPAGYKSFGRYTVACACAPNLCGPPDGGFPDAGDSGSDAGDDASADAGSAGDDGGLYGQFVCSPGTCSYTEQPSAACNTCIYDTLGEVDQLGPCGSPVLASCVNDTDCWAFFGCVQNCPVP